MLQTEFPFILPKGYLDQEGHLHREGAMRLATALDEIEPMRDIRVKANDAYLTVILLSRVITRLGNLRAVTLDVIENLFSADLAYLQDLYRAVNTGDTPRVEAVCPQCQHHFQMETLPLGG